MQQLHRELMEQGYTGSRGTVSRYVYPWRQTDGVIVNGAVISPSSLKPPKRKIPTARESVWILLKAESKLTQEERQSREQLLKIKPIKQGLELVEGFRFDDPNWYDTLVAAHENEATTGDPYFPCRFKYGKIDLAKVGVRFKGASSFRRNGVKRPFKFDFDEYEDDTTFLGLKKLNLHTNDLQPDFMREKLFTDFAGRFVPAVRMVHVRLYVNDVYYGLYTAMEQPDKTMMQSLFGDDEDGNLYEAHEELGGFGGTPPGGGTPPPPPPGGTPPPPPPDGTPPPINIPRADLGWLGSDPAAYYDLYQLETNEDDNDYSGLIEFLDILNNTPAADLPARLEQVADVEELLTWMALNNLFVSLDSYLGAAAECYLYDRDRDGRFIYVQWDHNESFGTTGDGTPLIANPFTFDAFWLPTNAGGGGGFPGIGGGPRPLLEKLWAVDDFKWLYKNRAALGYAEAREALRGKPLDEVAVTVTRSADAIEDAQRFIYHVRARRMQPVITVIYEREPYQAIFVDEENDLRITFDKNLRTVARPALDALFEERNARLVGKRHFICNSASNR